MADNDSTHIKIAVFCIVVSLGTAILVPILASDYSDGTSYAELYEERTALEEFTGSSMLSQTPFILTGVYTPYVAGEDYGVTEDGWLYGESVDYEYIGESTAIYLDPNQKSSTLFSQTIVAEEVVENHWYYADNILGDTWWTIVDGFYDLVGWTHSRTEVTQEQVNTYAYTGYRYVFEPMLSLYSETTETASDAALSIVWYDIQGQQGISSGLVLYDTVNNVQIANYSSTDIIAAYSTGSYTASTYELRFDGMTVNMHIRFDAEVLTSGMDLESAWDQGLWSLAFSVTTMDGILNVDTSMDMSVSLASIWTTYTDIFTFDLPNIPTLWQLVLWILCFVPLIYCLLSFAVRILRGA